MVNPTVTHNKLVCALGWAAHKKKYDVDNDAAVNATVDMMDMLGWVFTMQALSNQYGSVCISVNVNAHPPIGIAIGDPEHPETSSYAQGHIFSKVWHDAVAEYKAKFPHDRGMID